MLPVNLDDLTTEELRGKIKAPDTPRPYIAYIRYLLLYRDAEASKQHVTAEGYAEQCDQLYLDMPKELQW